MQLKKFSTYTYNHKTLLEYYTVKRKFPSLLALDHDDVVPELGLHRRVGVVGAGQAAHGERERRVLERADHGAPGHPAQITAAPRLVLAHLRRHLVELDAALQLGHRLHALSVLLAQYVPHLHLRGAPLLLPLSRRFVVSFSSFRSRGFAARRFSAAFFAHF